MRYHACTSLEKASAAPVVIDIQTFVRVEEGGRRKGDEGQTRDGVNRIPPRTDQQCSRPSETSSSKTKKQPERATIGPVMYMYTDTH